MARGNGAISDPGFVRLARLAALTFLSMGLVLTVVAIATGTVARLNIVSGAIIIVLPLALHLGVALLPWHRTLEPRWAEVVFFLYVAINAGAALGGFFVGTDSNPVMLWLGIPTVIMSGLTLRWPLHAVVSSIYIALALWGATGAEMPWGAFEIATYATVLVIAAAIAAISSDIARRALADAIRHRDMARRNAARLEAVADAGRSLATVDTQEVLETVADATIALGHEMVGLYVVEEDRPDHVRYATARNIPDDVSRASFSRYSGVVGEVHRRRDIAIVEDYPSFVGAMHSYVVNGLQSAMGVPVWVDGNIDGVIVVGNRYRTDYTDQDVNALHLLAGHAGRAMELARRFEEQTQTLSRLRELDRMKQDFVATVSHELRTPLTIISGMSRTVLDHWEQMEDVARRQLVERVQANADALDAVIARLLDFVRLERDELATRLEPFNASEKLKHIASRLTPMMSQHELVLEVAPDLDVFGDAELIERVVENLLSNAARHTPGGTRITLQGERAGATARITVADEGPGIPEQDRQRLGERFYRGGDPNERARGLGLGLALSSEILRLHGTSLTVESTVGQGSAFSFELPLQDVTGPRNSQAGRAR